MKLEEIVRQLYGLGIDFALVTRDRSAQPGGEELDFGIATTGPSRAESGLSNDPADAAWLFCRGIQCAFAYCSEPWVAAISREIRKLERQIDEARDNGVKSQATQRRPPPKPRDFGLHDSPVFGIRVRGDDHARK